MAHLFDTILQNFQASKASVNRYLSVGVVFAVVCFFYIVTPYFSYVSYQKEAQRTRAALESKLNVLKSQIEETQKVSTDAQNALHKIKYRIQSLPDQLYQTVLLRIAETINASPYVPQQQIQQVQSASVSNASLFPSDITDFNEAVNWYIRDWFKNLVDDLKQEVIEPVAQLNKSGLAGQSDTLNILTEAAITNINHYLASVDPDFWHTYEGPGGKISTADNLQLVVTHSFEQVQVQLDSLLKQASANMAEMNATLLSRQQISQKIDENIRALDDRIHSMNSPFGPIPLRTTELIILFPVLLAVLMILTVASLQKNSRLYTELWQQFESNEKTDNTQDFHLYTDCWYLSPYRSSVQPLMLVLFAVVLLGIYIYSSFLIFYNPNLFAFPGGGLQTARYMFFIIMYLAGLMVIAGCIWYGYRTVSGLLMNFSKRTNQEILQY